MSRIGNKAVEIAKGASVEVKGNDIVVKGPKGELTQKLFDNVTITVEGNEVKVARSSDEILDKTLHGTARALLNNMVEGVTHGFTKVLVIEGVGYKAQVSNKQLIISAGYSHTVPLDIPEDLSVSVSTNGLEITVTGIDKQKVGQFAANARAVRKPEPYHGKGLHYKDEVVRRKEGKKAK